MSPNAAVTRQQAFTMLARYLGLNTSSDAALNGFADEKSVAAYARGPVAAMINAGYVAGTADKKIIPKSADPCRGRDGSLPCKGRSKAVVPSAASALKDGIYEGEAAGYSGTTRVRVTGFRRKDQRCGSCLPWGQQLLFQPCQSCDRQGYQQTVHRCGYRF